MPTPITIPTAIAIESPTPRIFDRVGFVYVIKKRKIRFSSLLTVTLAGLFSAGFWKWFKDYMNRKNFYR